MKCTALIFSGRKNPEWEIKNEAEKQQIIGLLDLAEATNNKLQNSILGYAGFRVVNENVTYEIFNEVIEMTSTNGKKTLLDANRMLEKLLLQTVPPKFAGIIHSAIPTSF